LHSKSNDVLEDFIREEINDYESFQDSIKDIRKYYVLRYNCKRRLDKQIELYNTLDRRETPSYKFN
jgi:hypothetical protein